MQPKLRVLLDKALLLFVFAGWLAACELSTPEDAPKEIDAKQELVDLPTVRAISAQQLQNSMESPAAKARLFNFWATWCGPCLRELPVLQRFANEHDWELVLVNLDAPSGRASRIKAYLKKTNTNAVTSLYLDTPDPSLLLPEILRPFNDTIPVTLMVSKNGHLIARFDGETTQAILEEALSVAP